MIKQALPLLLVTLPSALLGCSGSSSPQDQMGSGGSTVGSSSGGGINGGGGTNGGAASGGGMNGGAASGGAASGGAGAMGSGGDASGTGGANGQSDATPSQGCGKMDGVETITAGGQSVMGAHPTSTRVGSAIRDFVIDIPADYDPNKPYRLIFSWHQAYGAFTTNATGLYPANPGPNFDAENYAFFGLRRQANDANDPVIFVAPEGVGNLPWDWARDAPFFDLLLETVSENLCIDESRVFTTGFSFGAMMSHALSKGRASKLRGAVTMAPANWAFTQPQKEDSKVAYFSITGLSDPTCNWIKNDATEEGGKYCALHHAEDNGCTIPNDFPIATVGSNQHVCYEFEDCDVPTKVCTFDGAHTPSSVSDGSPGDDGAKAFVPPLAWEFISSL